MSTQPTSSQAARTRIATAAPPLFNINNFLQTLPTAAQTTAHQSMPTCANPCQTAPISKIAQNEPTSPHKPHVPNSPSTAPNTSPRQPVPNTSKARQTTPNPAPAQNKPTAPPPSQNNPISPTPHAPSLPNSAKARQNQSYFQTKPNKPNRPPRPLTPNQLRAASLLTAGHSTKTIAAHLKINRHTLTRWKRHPLFQQELRRLIHASIARR